MPRSPDLSETPVPVPPTASRREVARRTLAALTRSASTPRPNAGVNAEPAGSRAYAVGWAAGEDDGPA